MEFRGIEGSEPVKVKAFIDSGLEILVIREELPNGMEVERMIKLT